MANRPGDKRYAVYTIHNAGGGTAQGVAFMFVGEDAYTVGIVGTGLMRSDQTVMIETDHQPREDRIILGIVTCRDINNRAVVWDGRGRRKRFRETRRKSTSSVPAIFDRMHPGVDLSGMPCRDHQVTTER